MNFKRESEGGNSIRTYFQIDGEFYQVINPKFLKVSLTTKIPRGKIKVLIQNSSLHN